GYQPEGEQQAVEGDREHAPAQPGFAPGHQGKGGDQRELVDQEGAQGLDEEAVAVAIVEEKVAAGGADKGQAQQYAGDSAPGAPGERGEYEHGDGFEQPAQRVGLEGQQGEVDQPENYGHSKTAALEGGHAVLPTLLLFCQHARVSGAGRQVRAGLVYLSTSMRTDRKSTRLNSSHVK